MMTNSGVTKQNEKLNISQQKLVDTILESLDKNVIPWNQPWKQGVGGHPHNAVTTTKYRGSNQIILSMISAVRGLRDPRWVTFNQAKEKGWRIKKGAKSAKLCYPLLYNKRLRKVLIAEDFNDLSQEQANQLKSESQLRLKYFDVFNAEEVIGIPKIKVDEMQSVDFSNDIAEKITNNIRDYMHINISNNGDQAFYRLSNDAITMPEINSFDSEREYYGTLFHELSHATGSPQRLNRDLSGSFGSASYSEEELVAEFSSVFLSQDVGFIKYDETLDNNVAYIQSWANAIRKDPLIISRAINNASKAYNYLYTAGKVKEYENELATKEVVEQKVYKEVPLDVIRRDVLISEYAETVLGLSLTSKGRGIISTQEHDSLMIYTHRNDFYRFSTAVGGNIIDFVMHMEDIPFPDALNRVREYYHEFSPEVQEYKAYEKREINMIDGIELPEPADNNKKVINYLTKTRCIPVGLVNDFIEKGMLYQDKLDNCVFVGRLDGVPLYASKRAAKKSSHFKGEVGSSITEVGVFYNNGGNTLILTEGVIDAMSIMTLKSNNKNFDYLAVNGIAKGKEVFNFHMVKRPEAQSYERVVIAFDNDERGEQATNKLIDYINENYPEIEVYHSYPNLKDWNEELVNMSKKHDGLDLDKNVTKANAVGMSL
ncbi:DUF1738 domain-containing protein [Erysipelothrix sp. HDW6B]|uniref:zincin-like metallopeptidase domain-containing protein n=1 Tax=Erysipelothrix sp. HDW6B TaxID=2714929 RepID=UPI00140E3EE7|nr:zincin-like metallopeptidase domain-containing protein [Erysipelothrix sp. HDW6B]QIK86362.1 DUF1738 domain-containing protein [Erysipelothrix sp. HDW6B]